MTMRYATLILLMAAIGLTGQLSADEVKVGPIPFTHAEVLSATETTLTFRLPNGRELTKPLRAVAQITVVGADTFNEAEELFAQGEYARAVQAYEDALLLASSTQRRQLIVHRQALAKEFAEKDRERPAVEGLSAAEYTGPTYMTIPIEGEFGLEVRDEVLRKCLDLARKLEPTAVILEIESGGGSLQSSLEMVKTLREYDDLRLVAYVKQAASAAAFLAMACEEIVMAPTGSIGGCVIYKLGPKGTPENIEAKWESIWRAEFRAAAIHAGHDPLLVEAMMRTDLVLHLTEEDGEPKLVEGGKGKTVKAKGEILTLAGEEAVECGLAEGVSDSPGASNVVLGINGWREQPSACKSLVARQKKEIEAAVRRCNHSFAQAKSLHDKAKSLKHKPLPEPEPGIFIRDFAAEGSAGSTRYEYRRCVQAAEVRLDTVRRLLEKYPLLLERIDFQPKQVNQLSQEVAKLQKGGD